MKKTKVILSLGTNIGNRESHLENALIAMQAQGLSFIKQSPVYESAAWGKTDQAAFLNKVVQIETELEPLDLLQLILKIEKDMGRQRMEKWSPRIIDIDILYFGSRRLDHSALKIPHPYIKERRFVLVPLCDILPEFEDPVSGLRIREILESCTDTSSVILFKS